MKIISYILIFHLFVSVVNFEQSKKFIYIILIPSFVVCLYGFLQYFFIFKTSNLVFDFSLGDIVKNSLERKRIFSFFLLPNTLAGYIVMLIPLSASCFMIYKKQKMLFFMLLIFLFISLFLTLSLGGWISLIFSFFIFLCLLGKVKNILFFETGINWCNKMFFLKEKNPAINNKEKLFKIKNIKNIFIVIFLLFIILFFIFLCRKNDIIGYNPIMSRFRTSIDTLKIIKDYPFGTGFGTFSSIYPKYKSIESGTMQHCHNSFLELTSEIGIHGFFFFLLFLFCLINFIFKKIKSLDFENKILCFGFISGSIGFLIHNLFDFDFYIPNLSILAVIFLGFPLMFLEKKKIEIKSSFKKFIIIFFVIISLIYLSYIFCVYQSEVHFNKAKNIFKDNIDRSIEEYQISKKLNPLNYLPYAHLGYCYKFKGEILKAIDAYSQSIKLNPHLPYLHKDIGILYLQKGDMNKAIFEIQKASELYPNNAYYHLLLAVIYKKLHYNNDFLKEYKKALFIEKDIEKINQEFEKIFMNFSQ
ncbi:MAG: O-antigen ligase family protein [bacterium]